LVEVEGGQYLVEVEGGQYLLEVEGGQYLIEVEVSMTVFNFYQILTSTSTKY
jgi:hypothetical protein